MTDNEVLLTTERFFWQLVSLQEKMKTLENSEKMLDHILSDVKVAVETGLTTRNDLTRVELERNRLAGFRLKAENGLQLLKLAFAQHIGVSAETLNIQPPPFDEFMPPTTGNETLALQNRPEYKLLQKNVDISKLQVHMEIGKNLPTVAVGAAYQYMRFDLHSKNGIKNNFLMGLASVSIPITDWWGGAHAIKMKKIELQAAENMRKENSDLLLVQMQKVRNELNEAYFQIQLSKKSIAVAEENLRMSNDNYNAGITTLTDLLEAQNLLQQTQDQFVEAVTEYYKKLAEHLQMDG
jgi:outer membrane protein TolC